jgi:hypothetical protein
MSTTAGPAISQKTPTSLASGSPHPTPTSIPRVSRVNTTSSSANQTTSSTGMISILPTEVKDEIPSARGDESSFTSMPPTPAAIALLTLIAAILAIVLFFVVVFVIKKKRPYPASESENASYSRTHPIRECFIFLFLVRTFKLYLSFFWFVAEVKDTTTVLLLFCWNLLLHILRAKISDTKKPLHHSRFSSKPAKFIRRRNWRPNSHPNLAASILNLQQSMRHANHQGIFGNWKRRVRIHQRNKAVCAWKEWINDTVAALKLHYSALK